MSDADDVFGWQESQQSVLQGVPIEDFTSVSGGNSSTPEEEVDQSPSANNSTNEVLDEAEYLGIPREVLINRKTQMLEIGKGSFGKVYGYPKEKPLVAIKVSKKNINMSTEYFEELQREVEINVQLSVTHKNIVGFFRAFSSNLKLYIALEYISGGTLCSYLKTKGQTKEGQSMLPEQKIINFTKQILTGLSYLHGKSIMHRDMRSPNILITDMDVLKISDFGLSKDLNTVVGGSKSSMYSNCNLVGYWLPPESIMSILYSREYRQDVKFDVWSLGIVILEVNCVTPPHFRQKDREYQCRIITNIDYVPDIPSFISPTMRNIIEKCLQREKTNRPSCEELLLLLETHTSDLMESNIGHADDRVEDPVVGRLSEMSVEESRVVSCQAIRFLLENHTRDLTESNIGHADDSVEDPVVRRLSEMSVIEFTGLQSSDFLSSSGPEASDNSSSDVSLSDFTFSENPEKPDNSHSAKLELMIMDEDEYLDKPVLPDNVDIPLEALLEPKSHMEYIAQGSFGKVYGYPREKPLIAIKIAKRTKDMSPDYFTELRREVKINVKLSHENIVQYLGSWESNGKLYIFLDYISGGSLHSYLKERNKGQDRDGLTALTELEIYDFTKQIITGLEYIHSRNIIHRSLRSPDILITDRKVLKITDFGVSKDLDTTAGSLSSLYSEYSLVSYWLPPERILTLAYTRSDRQDLKFDIWSLGIVVLEVNCVRPPHFQYSDMDYRCKLIMNEDYVPEIPTFITPTIRNIIERCLQRTIEDRPSCTTLLSLIEEGEFASGLQQDTDSNTEQITGTEEELVLGLQQDSSTEQIKESLSKFERLLAGDKRRESLEALIEIGLYQNLSSCLMRDNDITETIISLLLTIVDEQDGTVISLVQSNLLASVLEHVVEIENNDIVTNILLLLQNVSKLLEHTESLMNLGLSSTLIKLLEIYHKEKKVFGLTIKTSTDCRIVGHILGIFVNLLTFTSNGQKLNVIETLAINNIVTKSVKWIKSNSTELKHAAILILVELSCFDTLEDNSDIVGKMVSDSFEALKKMLSEDNDMDTVYTLIKAGVSSMNLYVVDSVVSRNPRAIKTFIEMGIVENFASLVTMKNDGFETIVKILVQVVNHGLKEESVLSAVQFCVILQILQHILENKNNTSSTHDDKIEGTILGVCSNVFKKLSSLLYSKSYKDTKNTITEMMDNNIVTQCKHWYNQDNVELTKNAVELLCRISDRGKFREHSIIVESDVILDIMQDILKCSDRDTVYNTVCLLRHVACNEGHYAYCTYMVYVGIVPALNTTLTKWDCDDDIVIYTIRTIKQLLKGASGDTKTMIVEDMEISLIQNKLDSPELLVSEQAEFVMDMLKQR